MSYISKCVVFMLLSLSYQSLAASIEEQMLKYVQYMKDCAARHSVTTKDMQKTFKNILVDSDSVKCMLACTFKRVGVTDDQGKISLDGVKRAAEEISAIQPGILKQNLDLAKACIHVNDEEISGDKEHCERAALIFKCINQKSQDLQ